MSNKSLTNKYRSKDFDDLVGQDHISHILKYQVAKHTRQANYLFFWPRGTGKTSTARLFAKAINCLTPRDGNPCNTCENCIAISNNSTMDIMEIDAASHTWVDNIREEIIDKLMYRPSLLKKRVTIIDEVHMLSKGAFNALLKTMEEPTEWMVFILATTELNKVPETIISRCQVFNFKKIPSWQIVWRLSYIAEAEHIQTTPQWLEMIAGLSDGCMRDAVKYLDQISVMGEVTEERISQFLGIVSEQAIGDFLTKLKIYQENGWDKNFEHMISDIENLSQQGVDLTIFPKQIMQYADKHFSEDSSFFSSVSNIASNLLSQSRRYPHPLLLYKTVLYTRQNAEIPTTLQPVKNQSTENIKQEVIQNPASIQNQEPENITNQIEGKAEWSNFTSFLSVSLKNLLEWQSEITNIQDYTASLIIINPLAKMITNKKENYDAICHAISQSSWQTISQLEFSFMSKDDYFAMKMGG